MFVSSGASRYPPRGQTPPVQYRTQLSQEDLQRTLQYTHQQQQQFVAGYHGAAGGTSHDMSKTGIPVNVHATVPPGQGQTPQQGMQHATTPIMYQQQHQRQAQVNLQQFSMPRTSIPQNIRQPRPPVTMANSPTSLYTSPMQHVYMAGQPPNYISQPTGTPIMISQSPQMASLQHYSQGARQPIQQYTLAQPAQYANYMQQSTPQPTPQYYQQSTPSGTVYYSNPTAAMIPQQQQQQQPQQQVPYQKRRKNIIQITDPNTGKVINDEILQPGPTKQVTPPNSGSSSSRATPVGSTPPPAPVPTTTQSNQIAALFAAQVAQTLTISPGTGGGNSGKAMDSTAGGGVVQAESSPSPEGSQVALQQPEQTPTPTPVEPPRAVEEEPPVQVTEVKPVHIQPPPPVAAVSVEKREVSPAPPSSTMAAPAEPEPAEPEPVSVSTEVTSSEKSEVKEDITVAEPSDETDTPSVVVQSPDSVAAEISATKQQAVEAVEEKSEVDVEEVTPVSTAAPVSEKEPESEDGRRRGSKPKNQLPPKVPVQEPTEDTSSSTEQLKSAQPEKIIVNNVDMVQRQKEVSRKEPSPDSRAFTEPELTNEPATTAAPVINNSDQGDGAHVKEEAKDVEAPSVTVIPQVEIKVEDRTVVEENNKNEGKSRDAKENVESSSSSSNNAVDAEESSEDRTIENTAPPVIKKDRMELKYTYREDQWSPLNPEGKMHYDRNFLLQLQFASESLEKPEGLPRLPDVILDKPITQRVEARKMPVPSMGGGIDFTPGFIRASPAGKPPSMSKGGRSTSRQKTERPGGPDRKVINLSIGSTEVKLHQSENRWKPAQKAKVEDPDEAKTEDLYKKVRGILNKLTPQKFQTLVQQILDLQIDTEARLRGAIDLVFEKAIDEPGFSVAYANMCKYMINLKVPMTDKPNEMITFRKLLLNCCQKEFEKDSAAEIDLLERQEAIDKAPEDQKKQLMDEKALAESKAKRRSLGNIRFIGELFKLKMLTENIMHDCVVKLLKSNDEDNLECLCRLLATIGKDIDHEKAKYRVDQYFQQMDKIVRQKKTSSRVRFMLQDVVELRRSFWVPRRADNAPKTIDQIHKEVQQEEVERQILIQKVTLEQKQQQHQHGRPGRGRHTGPSPQPQGEDGWMSVKSTRNTIDPSRMKLTKQNVDEGTIQLGPGGRGFGNWGRGSSGGIRPASQEADRPAPANRFSALSGAGQPQQQQAAANDTRDDRARAGRGLTPARDSKGARGQMGAGRGRSAARMSQEQDRESALQAVRNLTSGRTTPSGSRNASRDRERDRSKEPPRERQPEKPAGKEISMDDMEKRTKAIMDEYLHINDLKEARLCVKELESPNMMNCFVSTAMNHVLERSDQARRNTASFLNDLVKQGIITIDEYLKGLKELLEFAEDMEIDIPKIWTYLGQLIGHMVQDNSVPMKCLKPACDILNSAKAGTLVAEVLHEIAHNLGHIRVGQMWKSSGLTWSDFLPKDTDEAEFIQRHKVEFTVGCDEPRSPDAKRLGIEVIQTELDRLIITQNESNENVFDWIEANVGEPYSKEPKFIRALMTTVCRSAVTGTDGGGVAKVDKEVIKGRCPLLQRYLDHQALLELQALYALQALIHSLQHPQGVLRVFFDTLYDEDIISEDAFNQWEGSTDSSEQAGKGVALASVVQFFTWLREADDEEEQ